jgi:DNA-binding Xre family transcriptional regulator
VLAGGVVALFDHGQDVLSRGDGHIGRGASLADRLVTGELVENDLRLVIGRRVPLVEVAEKTGIDRKTLARMEQDEEIERIDTGVLKKLCAFYGVGVGEVLEYDPNGQRGLELAPMGVGVR